jgi:hypothetical protein
MPETKRLHKATYSTDKKTGGYLIRVEGPNANAFAGREVPVTLRSGEEHTEKLERLVWAGTDKVKATPVALYTFVSKPREAQEVTF